MLSFRILRCCLLIFVGLFFQVANAAGNPERCISQQYRHDGVRISKTPAVVPGLEPLVSVPSEDHLKLNFASADCCSKWLSPVGGSTSFAGPYDPTSQRLYLWGYWRNGWIEVHEVAHGWAFGDSEAIEPKLYEPAHDIEDVNGVVRSEVLGVLFYSGYTAPHWLTGRQTYQVHMFKGQEQIRVRELESLNLAYLGDDKMSGLAVFAPVGEVWTNNADVLTWYDGTKVVAPPAGLTPPTGICR